MFFHKTPGIIKWLYPQLVWSMPEDQKSIYLTFDDGPIPGLTDFILDTLENYNATATFFCVGENLKKHKNIATRAISNGHILGNHTFNHLNGWKTPQAQYLDNVQMCQDQILELGQKGKLLRPPYGRISRRQIKALAKDYHIIMWDVLSGDYSAKISRESCLRQTIKASHNGSIVLFHDNLKAEDNLKHALPAFLEHFHKQGYKFKSLCMD